MASSIPPKRALPTKEAALFRTILQMYETKLFKKGLKTADTILKKFPEHGETLCMKGLLLHSMDRREEGLDLIRKGVRLDLTSHICWHVYGIAQKTERNYEETLKCYMQALKFDKENMNILREVAQLQVQLRQFEGHVETRNTILRLRPQVRQNWLGLAFAHYLNEDFAQALIVLEHFENTVKDVADRDVEFSEVLLFHVRVLEAASDFAGAISFLNVNNKNRRIVDRVAIRQTRARLLTKLRQERDAEEAWRVLIERNPDCYDHYRDFLSNRGLSLDAPEENAKAEVLKVLSEFASSCPLASAPRRLALDVAEGVDFRVLARSYLIAGLRRGSPSLFSDIKSLYKHDAKRLVIEELVEDINARLSAENALQGFDTANGNGDVRGRLQEIGPSSGTSEGEAPTTYIWTLYFLAQHYSHLRMFDKALALIDEALDHTPSLPELLMAKARLLKRAGDPYGAAKWMEDARRLDGQDRFLNGKSAKYMMAAGDPDGASAILGLFTKKDAASPGADLEEMQSTAYLLQDGDTHVKQGKLGLALKRYRSVVKIFNDFEEDQFDYYVYTMRKFTFSAYLELLSFEDKLRCHPEYVKAVLLAAKIYIHLHDDPHAAAKAVDSASKRSRKKRRNDTQMPEQSAKANGTNGKHAQESPAGAVDPDPDGHILVSVKAPLEEAHTLLRPSESLPHNDVELWLAVHDVALRRKKYLQALKALRAARTIQPGHPELHVRIVGFASLDFSTQDSSVSALLASSVATLIPQESVDRYNAEYLQQHAKCPPAVLAAARGIHILRASSGADEIRSLLSQLTRDECPPDVKTCYQALQFIQNTLGASCAEDFRQSCTSRFGLSTIFLSPDALEDYRRGLESMRGLDD